MGRRYGNDIVQIEFLNKGMREVLMSEGVQQTIKKCTDAIAKEAGEGFKPEVVVLPPGGGYKYPGRVMGKVTANTAKARRREATDKVLTRAATVRREV